MKRATDARSHPPPVTPIKDEPLTTSSTTQSPPVPVEDSTATEPPAAPRSGLRRLLDRFPEASRRALGFETLSSLGSGGYAVVFPMGLVVLEEFLHAPAWQLAVFAAAYFGSSLFSPLVTYLGRVVPMRTLVVVPNLIVAAMLPLTLMPGTGSLFFAVLIGATFVVRVFPRAGEMNMYRLLYPVNCRGAAIGITKAVAALSSLIVTFVGWGILEIGDNAYPALFVLVAAMLVLAAYFYARIPVPAGATFETEDSVGPWTAFRRGATAFLGDQRFLNYQLAFSIAGIANHFSLWYVVQVLDDVVGANETLKTWVVAILPALFIIASAPVWGRLLDGWSPMSARAVFNVIQTIAYAFYALGGWLGTAWPFVVGAILHATGNGGGMINWLTGSMYFARRDQVSLYNGVHVCLTGVRGILGPIVGYVLAIRYELGWGVFVVSSLFSLLGVFWMLALRVGDTGPREIDEE